MTRRGGAKRETKKRERARIEPWKKKGRTKRRSASRVNKRRERKSANECLGRERQAAGSDPVSTRPAL